MTYDGENRMTAFSGGGGAASYTYDGNGLRVIKSVQGGTTKAAPERSARRTRWPARRTIRSRGTGIRMDETIPST